MPMRLMPTRKTEESVFNSKVNHGHVIDIGGWNDYIVTATSIDIAHASAPVRTLFVTPHYLPVFTGTGVNAKDVTVAIHIEHDYRTGTKLYPHIHWSHIIASPTGSVKWTVNYIVAKGHSVGTYPSNTAISVTQVAGAQFAHHIAEVSETDAIPSTSIEPDSVVIVTLSRNPADAADTFENDAYLIAIDLHYQSTGLYTNEKVSPFTQRFDIRNR